MGYRSPTTRRRRPCSNRGSRAWCGSRTRRPIRPRRALLHELRFGWLVMLALVAADEVWGLVEVYRKSEDGFTATEVELADREVRRLGDELAAMLG